MSQLSGLAWLMELTLTMHHMRKSRLTGLPVMLLKKHKKVFDYNIVHAYAKELNSTWLTDPA